MLGRETALQTPHGAAESSAAQEGQASLSLSPLEGSGDHARVLGVRGNSLTTEPPYLFCLLFQS